MSDTRKPAKRTAAAGGQKYEGFSDSERAAMKDRAQELKAVTRRGPQAGQAAGGEGEVLAKIAEMRESDRALAERLHAVIKASVPDLVPRLWYGMPAYATAGKGGKMICFFQSAQKFNTRYATLGFSDEANLDDGPMWPTYYALTELTAAVEARIVALVRQALS